MHLPRQISPLNKENEYNIHVLTKVHFGRNPFVTLGGRAFPVV